MACFLLKEFKIKENRVKKVIHVLLFLVAFNSVFGQDDYVKDNFIRYKDWIYRPNIKTVELRETSFELAAPLIELGSTQQLVLSFDDLDGGYEGRTGFPCGR